MGMEKIQKYLNTIGYGNADMPGGLADFWLDSSLKISPLEQVEMLKKQYSYDLPFSHRNINEEIKSKGVVFIDEKPRYGANGAKIAFIHSKSTKGVLLGLCHKD